MRFLSVWQLLTISVELHLSMAELCSKLHLLSLLPTSLKENNHTFHVSFLSRHLLYIYQKMSVQLGNSDLYVLVVSKRKTYFDISPQNNVLNFRN